MNHSIECADKFGPSSENGRKTELLMLDGAIKALSSSKEPELDAIVKDVIGKILFGECSVRSCDPLNDAATQIVNSIAIEYVMNIGGKEGPLDLIKKRRAACIKAIENIRAIEQAHLN